MGMFDFFLDIGNYDQRKVDRFKNDSGLIIDTCFTSDTGGYETGVVHPKYNGGEWVIVEEYRTKEEAQTGHDKWVKKMTQKKLPKKLKDVSSCGVAELCDVFSAGENWREQKQEDD